MINEKKLLEDVHRWDMEDSYPAKYFELLIRAQPSVREEIKMRFREFIKRLVGKSP